MMWVFHWNLILRGSFLRIVIVMSNWLLALMVPVWLSSSKSNAERIVFHLSSNSMVAVADMAAVAARQKA